MSAETYKVPVPPPRGGERSRDGYKIAWEQMVRFGEAQQAKVEALTREIAEARQERDDDRAIVNDLMDWAPACPSAEGKGIVYELLDRARAMLARWEAQQP